MIQRRLHTRLMGSDFELIAVESGEALVEQRLSEGVNEISRIEALLTEFHPDSQTSRINRSAGLRPVRVDPEVVELVRRCLYLSRITQGAFDISSGVLRSLYRFREHIPTLPDEATLLKYMDLVGYNQITISSNTVGLRRKGMRIGFGAVGKGYAADQVRRLWKRQGVTAGVVNASGDLCAWGDTPWKVGIADPKNLKGILFYLPIQDSAIATSGSAEQYFEIGGVRYSHNLDPRTGRPVTDIQSASVISPSAELSDALATAVTVMGVEAGLYLVDQLPQVHAILVDSRGRVHTSKHIQTLSYA